MSLLWRCLPQGGGERGFALVVTLALMILLTVIAVGLLSLATISLRTSGIGSSQAVARENARLAMMLALADLQKYAGPDQRVTSTAALLASTPGDRVANNSWVGVWRTDDATGNGPPADMMVRSNRSGFIDARTATVFEPKSRALSWIVSGETPDPEQALSGANSVEMRSGTNPVRAALVPVKTATDGRLAYWVSDESTKAKLSLVDPYMNKQPSLDDPEGYKRLVAPLALDSSAIFEGATAPSAEEAAKLLSNGQIELSTLAAGISGKALEKRIELREKADDFTVYSRSVLSDPVAGGMKADLTAYLEEGTQPALGPLAGIKDADGIISSELPNRTMAGPKFGMLRNWYDLRKQISGSMADRVITDQLPNTYATASGKITDPGIGFVKPLIQPVMAEAVYYLRHVIDTSSTPAKMTELIYPRVVLWNPFNVKLQTSGHIVHFDFRLGHRVKVDWPGAAEPTVFNLNLQFSQNFPQHLAFYVPPTEFDPGEALCFTSGGSSQITPYTPFDSNYKSNILSATENPSGLKCFKREWPGSVLPATFKINGAKISYGSVDSVIWNTNQRTQGVVLHSLIGNPGSVTIANLLSGSGPPVVRQISMDNYSRGNNGRWLVGYTPTRTYTLSGINGVPPDSLLAFGARFRYLYETYANRTQGATNKEPWFGAPLIHHNIGAPNIHRWPIDNSFGLKYTTVTGTGGFGPHLYSYDVIAQARQWSEWLDPEVLAHRTSGGKYRSSVFTDASFSTSESTYPVYDLPSSSVPLVSLGALQHVQLSPFVWHPTQTIGQSFAPPYLPAATRAAVTSRSSREEGTLWSGKVQYLNSDNYDITGFDKIATRGTKDILFNDLCFEVNQALWDRYFLSGIPRAGAGAAWSGSTWALSKPLPNARLKINESLSKGGSKNELTSFYRASRSLWLDGGFNVNSTSIEAWESMLRSFRDIQLPSRSSSGGSLAGTPYAGVLVPEGGGSPALAPTDDRFWNAYRKLTDTEIRSLATEIVGQVLQRGPFLGVSDFVNRRLVTSNDRVRSSHGKSGAIQSAIDRVSGLNESTQSGWLMPNSRNAARNYTYGAEYWGGPIQVPEPQNYEFYENGVSSQTWAEATGAAAHLNQGDVLQQIGSVLVARGDTFVIRGYGEALDKSGNVTARAMCEAVVQRTPVPVNPDETIGDLNPKLSSSGATDFGREFRIESFRWLAPEEV